MEEKTKISLYLLKLFLYGRHVGETFSPTFYFNVFVAIYWMKYEIRACSRMKIELRRAKETEDEEKSGVGHMDVLND